MDLYVGSVVIDVNDLETMKSFWEQVLGYETTIYEEDDWAKLEPPDGRSGPNVSLQKVPERKTEKNRLHLDLYSKQPDRESTRVQELGAELVEGARPDRDFMLLADPEGNLFCIIDKRDG